MTVWSRYIYPADSSDEDDVGVVEEVTGDMAVALLLKVDAPRTAAAIGFALQHQSSAGEEGKAWVSSQLQVQNTTGDSV